MFSCSIAENIAYGADDPASVTAEQIEQAAAVANAAAFIQNFPQGFNTVVGEKGVLLSGAFLLLFVAKCLCSKKLSKRFLSRCYFLIRLLPLEFMKLTFLFSQISFVCDNSPIPFTFSPEVFPGSHWGSHWVVFSHSLFFSSENRCFTIQDP